MASSPATNLAESLFVSVLRATVLWQTHFCLLVGMMCLSSEAGILVMQAVVLGVCLQEEAEINASAGEPTLEGPPEVATPPSAWPPKNE